MALSAVLVRTFNPGNLGAAARVARNFGASLLLYQPRTETSHPDALAYASGAEDVLQRAPALESWEEVQDRADLLVALTSLRGRRDRGLPPRVTWAEIRRRLARGERVGLVFGPERGGLTSEEIHRCGARTTIPASPAFPTLNLAQAVAVGLALVTASGRPARISPGPASAEDSPAPAREASRLLARLHDTLLTAGYPGPGRSQAVLSELDSFLRRARPTSREVTLLLGALNALQRSQRR